MAPKPPRLVYTDKQLKALRRAFGTYAGEPIFTVWSLELRDGKWTKVPRHPHGHPGITLDEALSLYEKDPNLAGIGVKFGRIPGTPLSVWGADYDGAAKGSLPRDWPASETYSERSPSGGDHFHLLGLRRGEPLEGKRQGAVELYGDGRFFTLTGDCINGERLEVIDPRPYYAAIGVTDPKPYATPRNATSAVRASPIRVDDLTNKERQLAEAVRGIDNSDLSARDHAALCELIKRGATDEEAGRVLCVKFWREKLRKNRSYLARSIAAARKEVGDDTAASVEEGNANSEMVKEFREKSKAIGEGPAEVGPPPKGFTLSQMIAEAIFISDGSQVALPEDDPRQAWSFSDFERLTAASVHRTGQKGRPISAANAWLRDPQRQTVHGRTFKAGGKLFCQSPDDVPSINTWREPPRVVPPSDWKQRVKPFLDHVEFLVPDQMARKFLLDWLAHIEQRPGVLPHVHVLMVAERQGIGRNWLASILARVWAGAVALDVDLPALLDGGFTGRLSRKILVVVNEIAEGGGVNAYRQADRLKSLLTDETRSINPKYGRQYEEWNAARWLMFSNRLNALPLDHFDRRVYVVENPSTPKPAKYYADIYNTAADPLFIASIREWLRTRDIRNFNPGQIAPMTSAKMKVIEASMSEPELRMRDLVAQHPVDVIASDRLCLQLWDLPSKTSYAALQHIATRVGAVRYSKRVWLSHRGHQQNVWILRNAERWLAADSAVIAAEVSRGEKAC
jgi:hypothetical protein